MDKLSNRFLFLFILSIVIIQLFNVQIASSNTQDVTIKPIQSKAKADRTQGKEPTGDESKKGKSPSTSKKQQNGNDKKGELSLWEILALGIGIYIVFLVAMHLFFKGQLQSVPQSIEKTTNATLLEEQKKATKIEKKSIGAPSREYKGINLVPARCPVPSREHKKINPAYMIASFATLEDEIYQQECQIVCDFIDGKMREILRKVDDWKQREKSPELQEVLEKFEEQIKNLLLQRPQVILKEQILDSEVGISQADEQEDLLRCMKHLSVSSEDLRQQREKIKNTAEPIVSDKILVDKVQLLVEKIDDLEQKEPKVKRMRQEVSSELSKILDAVGLEEIQCKIGKKPHPELHNIAPVKLYDGDYDEGVIREVLQRGLRYKDNPEKIIKRALVKIQREKDRQIHELATQIEEIMESQKALEGRIAQIERNLGEIQQLYADKADIDETTQVKEKAEQIIQFYDEFEDAVYAEYCKSQEPEALDTTDITNFLKSCSAVIESLKNEIESQSDTNCEELCLKLDEFRNTIVSRRQSIDTGIVKKKKLDKQIQPYAVFKEKWKKQLIHKLLREGSEIPQSLNVESAYLKHVEVMCQKSLKVFINALKHDAAFRDTEFRQEHTQFLKSDFLKFIRVLDKFKGKCGNAEIDAKLEGHIADLLKLAGIEEIPIELGKKAHPKIHDIIGIQRGNNYEDGVIIEVKAKAYRYKTNKRIIIKPQVVCGERS